MGAERVTIRRNQPIDWPTFAEANLPDDVGLLAVENRRWSWEDMVVAVGTASDVLRAALARTDVVDRVALWLLAVGRPVPTPRTPLRRYLFERAPGFWIGRETDARSPVVLPRGERSEVRVDWAEETVGFGGSIRFALDELPVALEAARRSSTYHAVVVATGPDDADPLPMLLPPSPPPNVRVPFPLFDWAIPRVADRTFPFAVRAWGAFDDVEVGPDLAGRTELLDPLEAALRAVLAEAAVDEAPDEPEDEPRRGPHFTTWDGRRYDY